MPPSSSRTNIEFTKHTLIGLQVTGGLLLSIGASTWYSYLIGTIVVLQVGIFLHFDALVSQELDISERHLKDHFPEDVRDRLQEQQQQQIQEEVDCDGVLMLGDSSSSSTSTSSAPIFDLHPEATVLFADLKGFTQWSHNRNPDDVFQLLEAIYATMDELAVQHKVYKVETVGDCYLAVAGAPMADSDHALHMAEFAQAMLKRVSQLLRGELLDSNIALPDGTSQLQLRVGLHSGPVVLGVLRCAKQRLQIFGGTVNKASRMESTGQAGKIQISSATAHYLSLKHNKGHWLSRRLGRVEAKGWGRVITYWLDTSTMQNMATATTMTKQHNRTHTTSTLEHFAVAASSDEFLENWLSYATSSSTSSTTTTKTGNSRQSTSHGPLLPRGRLPRARTSFGPLPPSKTKMAYRNQQQQQSSSCTSSSTASNKPMTVQRPSLFLSSRSRSVGNCFVAGIPVCPMQ